MPELTVREQTVDVAKRAQRQKGARVCDQTWHTLGIIGSALYRELYACKVLLYSTILYETIHTS